MGIGKPIILSIIYNKDPNVTRQGFSALVAGMQHKL